MANFRNKYDPLRLFLKRVGTVLLLALLVLVGIGVWKVYIKEKESRLLRDQAEMQEADLAQQSAQLNAETAKLETERGKEESLRQQYDVGKQGEGLIVIVDPHPQASIQASSTFMSKLKKAFIWW